MKFPPYGKQLMEMRMRGEAPREAFVVTDWGLARNFVRVVVPDDFPLDGIELRYLAGIDVNLVHRSHNATRALVIARAILNVRPRLFNAFNVDVPINAIIKNLAGEVFL